MEVQRDEPGRALYLTESRPGSRLGVQVAFLFLLLSWAGLGVMLWAAVRRGRLTLSDPGDLLTGVCALGAIALLLFAYTGLVLALARYSVQVLIDRARNELRIEERGLFGLFPRESSFRLDDVRRISLVKVLEWMGRSKGGLRFAMVVEGAHGAAGEIRFHVDDLDTREEALDFAHRVGAAAGLRHLRVERNDAGGFGVTLQREAAEGTTPVTVPDCPADYERDQVGSAALPGASSPPPFRPESLRAAFRVERWDPGREVRFARPFQWKRLAPGLLVPLVCLVPVGIVAATLAVEQPKSGTIGAAASAMAAVMGFSLVIGGLLVWHSFRTGEVQAIRVRLDWTARRVFVSRGAGGEEVPFASLKEIETRGVRRHVPGSKYGPAYDLYRYQVWARFEADGRTVLSQVPLVESDDVRDDSKGPYDVVFPIGANLAHALSVRHRVVDFA